MKLEYCNLRNAEFREFFAANLFFSFLGKKPFLLNNNNEKITDNDLIQFYLECSELLDYCDIPRVLFNYKMNKIKNDRLVLFLEIVREKTGLSIVDRISYLGLLNRGDVVMKSNKFNELVDIFLDEI